MLILPDLSALSYVCQKPIKHPDVPVLSPWKLKVVTPPLSVQAP